jgi:hypothetical protein
MEQGQWFLNHDTSPRQTSLVVQQFLAEKNIPLFTQTAVLYRSHFMSLQSVPYSEMGLMGTRFATMEGMKSSATAETLRIPNEFFRRCLQRR